VALGVNPQAKSSSWLARLLKNHLQAFGVGATALAVVQELATEQPAVEQQDTLAEPAAV